MNRLLVVSGVMAMGVASAAQADTGQRWPNWYVGLSGGVSFLDSSDLSGTSTGNLDYNSGAIGTVSLGYAPGATFQPLSNMRFEAELGYHNNSLDTVTLNPAAAATAHGSVESFSYMGNAYYDFRNTSAWTPYIGGGLGGASISMSKASGLGNTSGTDTVFAYQFMGGFSYAPTTLPMTEWSLGYRYFVEDSPEFQTATGKIKLDNLSSHNVEAGARFKF